MYSTGQGVKQDFAKALYWYEKSAIQGFVPAQEKLMFSGVNKVANKIADIFKLGMVGRNVIGSILAGIVEFIPMMFMSSAENFVRSFEEESRLDYFLTRRPEQLSVEEFVELTKLIEK